MNNQNRHEIGKNTKSLSGQLLYGLLNSIDGKKDLVLDNKLLGSLDFITSITQLKSCNVEKIIKLEPGSAPGVTKNCVYLICPTIPNTQIIADHISANANSSNKKNFWIINVPRKVISSTFLLESEGVYGNAVHLELPLGFFRLEDDLLSLQTPEFFQDFFLSGDLYHIHSAARALVQLCNLSGPVPKIFGQGKCAQMVIELMNTLIKNIESKPLGSERISQLVVLDRDLDYASVLLSQLTYEGMLDEFFGITNSRIIFPKEVTGKDEPLKVALSSNDEVFDEIRNKYFASVFGFLGQKAKELQTKSETSGMSISDMKNFVSKEIKNIKQQQLSLSLHIGASEVILNTKNKERFQDRLRIERDIIESQNLKGCLSYIEDAINSQQPVLGVFRLLCLLSLAQGGLVSSDYEFLLTLFRQSYGPQHLVTLHKLKKLGLLTEQPPILTTKASEATVTKLAEKIATAVAIPKGSCFKTVSRRFDLIPPEEQTVDLKNPSDLSYVFGGSYVPLIARIVEQVALTDSIKYNEENIKVLPGPNVNLCQKTNRESGFVVPSIGMKTKTVLVFVLGGITYAEVAALRLLGKMAGTGILIATTSMISGDSLLQSLCPQMPPPEPSDQFLEDPPENDTLTPR